MLKIYSKRAEVDALIKDLDKILNNFVEKIKKRKAAAPKVEVKRKFTPEELEASFIALLGEAAPLSRTSQLIEALRQLQNIIEELKSSGAEEIAEVENRYVSAREAVKILIDEQKRKIEELKKKEAVPAPAARERVEAEVTTVVPKSTAAPATEPEAPPKGGWLKRVWSGTKKIVGGAAEVASHPLKTVEKGAAWSWEKSKKYLINKEVRNMAIKTAMETGATIFGVKTFYDITGYMVGKARGRDAGGGWGDIEKYAYAKQDAKKGRAVIKNSFEEFLSTYGVAPENRTEADKTQVTAKAKILYEKIAGAPGLTKEDKTKFKKHLADILRSYEQGRGTVEKATKEKVEKLTDLYIQNKVSGMGLVKDALNTALTATGFVALRGGAYTATAALEGILKANVEYNKANFGKPKDQKESRLRALTADALINSAKETVHDLTLGVAFKNQRQGVKGKQRVVNFFGAASKLVRAGFFGHLVVAEGETAKVTLDRLLKSFSSNNVPGSIWHNFEQNADRVFNLPHNLQEKFLATPHPEAMKRPQPPQSELV